MTRSSVREALAVLDAMRITERKAKSGIFLRNAVGGWRARRAGAAGRSRAGVRRAGDARRHRGADHLRAAGAAAGLPAAHRGRPRKLHRLLDAYAAMIGRGRNPADADVDFHLALVAAEPEPHSGAHADAADADEHQLAAALFRIRRDPSSARSTIIAPSSPPIEARDEAAATALVQRHVQTAAADVRALAAAGRRGRTNRHRHRRRRA